VGRGSSRLPETAGFVEEQRSPPALPLLVRSGRVALLHAEDVDHAFRRARAALETSCCAGQRVDQDLGGVALRVSLAQRRPRCSARSSHSRRCDDVLRALIVRFRSLRRVASLALQARDSRTAT
jgi:hypothetical protein